MDIDIEVDYGVKLTDAGWECEIVDDLYQQEYDKQYPRRKADIDDRIAEAEKELAKHLKAVKDALKAIPELYNRLHANQDVLADREEEKEERRKTSKELSDARKKAKEEAIKRQQKKIEEKQKKMAAPKARKRDPSPWTRNSKLVTTPRGDANPGSGSAPSSPRATPPSSPRGSGTGAEGRPLVPVFIYRPQNEEERKRLEAWVEYTPEEWAYGNMYGREALEERKAQRRPIPVVGGGSYSHYEVNGERVPADNPASAESNPVSVATNANAPMDENE